MTPRTLVAVSLGALVPVWAYAMLVHGGLYVALASSVCVLLVAWTLYTVFGPHEGAAEHVNAEPR
ncbi:hypothetical protein GRX01_04295 [Halobaculum sp. WSA2]|uniref:DUF8131 domain-containing protein n=1 Tax=Halobaculum saliterrae TaxID=2073113 RepID=A0A6B0SQ29_9EURY|nr:hypothetical protein [Halobaculum saliterrae]MXR40567.1 hypothetical protein [Halobaculum saliterrae]